MLNLDIVMFADGLPIEWDKFESDGLGGSETSALSAVKELARRGHRVVFFCRCENEGIQPDGVEYRKIGHQHGNHDYFMDYVTTVPHDVLILQRIPQMLTVRTQSKLNILWMHDLAWKGQAASFRGVLWNIDQVWAGSDFATKQLMEVYGGPKELYKTQPLGVELSYWEKETFRNIKREKNRLMYVSRPERGLDVLLFDIMPGLIKKVPDIKLYLAGYNLQATHMKSFYDRCWAQAAKLKDNVVNLGHLPKEQLYKEYMKSEAYIYPTYFEETFCITAVECQRSGVPFITTHGIGALQNTLNPSSNIFVKGDAHNKRYHEKFINETVKFLNLSDNKKEKVRQACVRFSQKYTWKSTVDGWERSWQQLFDDATRNKFSLVRHLYRNNDVIAARKLAEKTQDIAMLEIIDRNYAFIDNGGYVDYYNNYSFDPEQLKRSSAACANIPRIKAVTEMVKDKFGNKDETRILDYGCGEGVLTFPLAQLGDNYKILGVDVAESKINIALDAYKERQHTDNLGFHSIDPDPSMFVATYLDEWGGKKFDCITMSECLEHVPDPQRLLDSLEELLNPGGWVILTTPYGPFESCEDNYYLTDRRLHLYNFSRHDFREMFKHKDHLSIHYIFAEEDKNDPSNHLSHTLVCYQKSGNDCCQIDYERKFNYQAPQGAVSTCIIYKNNEDTISKCLKSINLISDEVILIDTGSTDGTSDIIKKFGPKFKVFKGSDPLEHGFETPRNEALKYVKGSWVLWMDTDEVLVNSKNVFKYLKHNHFNGYSIRQNHFTIEPLNAFEPDLPVRLFRADKNIRFYGLVHEHPETGINESVGLSIGLGDVDIAHPAYLTESIRRDRFSRNFPLLQRDREKYPDRVLGKFMWIRDLIHISRYMLEQQQGQMTEDVYRYLSEVIEITRKDFLYNKGSKNFLVYEVTKYYSEACALLGLGFETTLSINIDRQRSMMKDKKVLRFADVKDFRKFMETYMDECVDPFTGKYVM